MPGVAEDTAIRKEEIQLAVLQFLEKLIQGKLLGLEADAREKAPQGQHRRSERVCVKSGVEGVLDTDADDGCIDSKRCTGNNEA